MSVSLRKGADHAVEHMTGPPPWDEAGWSRRIRCIGPWPARSSLRLPDSPAGASVAPAAQSVAVCGDSFSKESLCFGMRYNRPMANQEGSSSTDGSVQGRITIEPPAKHKAADRAGKTLGNMAGSINKALGAETDPVVLNRKGRHVSIKDLEDLIDKALEE